MNLQQLYCLCAVVQNDFSVSEAARKIGISQPAVSKQIQSLENEIGLDLLVRKGNRIVGLTPQGSAMHRGARRALLEINNLKKLAGELGRADKGRFTIATTNTYARFVLPPAIRDFMLMHSNIELILRQGSPSSILQWILAGEADIGISNRPPDASDELVFQPCGELSRSVIAPVGHPLLNVTQLNLREIAKYPIATLDDSFEGGRIVRQVFTAAKIRPNIILSALDPGVVKTYVGIGMGIAILPSVAFDPDSDTGMQMRSASHLFPNTTTHIQLRRSQYLPGYVRRFIQLLAPQMAPLVADEA